MNRTTKPLLLFLLLAIAPAAFSQSMRWNSSTGDVDYPTNFVVLMAPKFVAEMHNKRMIRTNQASATTDGWLSSNDWSAFNAKQPALGFTPPTNNYPGITNALGFKPATNGGAIAYSQLPYEPGVTNNNGASFTNITGSNSIVAGTITEAQISSNAWFWATNGAASIAAANGKGTNTTFYGTTTAAGMITGTSGNLGKIDLFGNLGPNGYLVYNDEPTVDFAGTLLSTGAPILNWATQTLYQRSPFAVYGTWSAKTNSNSLVTRDMIPGLVIPGTGMSATTNGGAVTLSVLGGGSGSGVADSLNPNAQLNGTQTSASGFNYLLVATTNVNGNIQILGPASMFFKVPGAGAGLYLAGTNAFYANSAYFSNEVRVASILGTAVLPEVGLSLSDNTTANASSVKHGLMPKLSGDAEKFFAGDGTQIHPPVRDVIIASMAEIPNTTDVQEDLFDIYITKSGNTNKLWLEKKSQTSNKFYGSPDGSGGFPSFRALTLGDMPSGITADVDATTKLRIGGALIYSSRYTNVVDWSDSVPLILTWHTNASFPLTFSGTARANQVKPFFIWNTNATDAIVVTHPVATNLVDNISTTELSVPPLSWLKGAFTYDGTRYFVEYLSAPQLTGAFAGTTIDLSGAGIKSTNMTGNVSIAGFANATAGAETIIEFVGHASNSYTVSVPASVYSVGDGAHSWTVTNGQSGFLAVWITSRTNAVFNSARQ